MGPVLLPRIRDTLWAPFCYLGFGTPYRSHLQRQAVFFVEFLPYEDGTERLSRNVGNYQNTMRNIPEERRPYLGYLLLTRISISYHVSLCSNVSFVSQCN